MRAAQHPARGGGGVEDAVALDQQAAFQAFAQLGFALTQGPASDQLAVFSVGQQIQVFAVGDRHFLRIGRQPQGAVVAPPTAFGKSRGQLAPALQGILTEGQFRRVVVQHQQMTHARRRGAVPAGVEYQHLQATLGQGPGTGCTDDAGTDDDHVGGQPLGHRRMPQANGSSASMISVASALT